DVFEIGLVVEDESGVDAAFEDIVEELGNVDARGSGPAAPADVAEERLVERHVAVRDTDDPVELRSGDVHSTPDGNEQWHGATHHHFMTRISITQGPATWGEH